MLALTVLYAAAAGSLTLAIASGEAGDVRDDAVDAAEAQLAVLAPLPLKALDTAFGRQAAAGDELRVWARDGTLRYRLPRSAGAPSAPDIERGHRGEAWSGERAATRTDDRGLSTYVPLKGGSVMELEQPIAPIRADAEEERRGVLLQFGGIAALVWLALLPLSARFARAVAAPRGPRRRRALLKRLSRGLANGELELHYQPKLDLGTGRAQSAEALVRWRRDGELVAPGEFLPVVEESPLIEALTSYVLDSALAQVREWLDAGLRIGVAVNLAPVNLEDPELPARVERALREHEVEPSLLTLEVTETAVMEDEDTAHAVLVGLAALGVRLSVDDFGTGYSSLARVTRHPFTEVKIDRSFVDELTNQERPIVATMIRLAKTLDLHVVAEGVEDEATLNALRALGCDMAQGYLLGRPCPAEELPAALGRIPTLLRPTEDVRAILDEVREALALDATFVAEFVEHQEVLRWTTGRTDAFGIGDGATADLCESYCDRVVSGVFPSLIPDARSDPLTRDLPITAERRIGAYVGVPITRADGTLYGTLCGLSTAPRPDLSDREVAAMRRSAERLVPLLPAAHLSMSRNGAPMPVRAGAPPT